MISSRQIKAARALLGWKGQDLADKSGVGVATLRRYEEIGRASCRERV